MIESAPLEGTAFTGCGKTQGPSLLWPTTEPSLPQSRSAGRNKIAEHGAEGGMLGGRFLRIPEPASEAAEKLGNEDLPPAKAGSGSTE